MATIYQPNGFVPLGNSYNGNDASATDGDNIDVSAVDALFNPKMIRGFYVGVAGNVAVTTAYGNLLTFTAVPVGTIVPVVCQAILHSGTTATNIAVLY